MYAPRSLDALRISPQFDLANPIVWHIGISPTFPSPLLLSNDAAVETLLSDIPFISVGILGFAVATFFFVMRKFNYVSAPVFASVMTGFIASVLDIGQVLIRGSAATDADTEVDLVLPYLIAREVLLAVSIGFRFLYYMLFVSLPPYGEPSRRPQTQDVPLNFLRMDNEVHSGHWMRWGFAGFVLKHVLLAATIAFTILQLLWRLIAKFSNYGGIYRSSVILEIAMSGLFILKLFANAGISPLRPRWKTLRNYLPIIIALLFRLAVAIGDVVQFQFSESSLGRFLQALELYILVLYILVSSFYGQRIRLGILKQSHDKQIEVSPMEQSDTKSPNTTASFSSKEVIIRSPISNKPSNRLSSWLIDIDTPRTDNTDTYRSSRARRLSSWLMGKGPLRAQPNGRNKMDVEDGTSPFDQVTGFAISPDSVLPKSSEQQSGSPLAHSPTGRLKRLAVELNLASTSQKTTLINDTTKVSKEKDSTMPPKPIRMSEAPNPSVYGTNGILNYYGAPGSESNSARSSGMASLLRQQAELDRSVAELQLFRDSMGTAEPTSIQKTIESFRSDFSLSNFPRPPSETVTSTIADDKTDIGNRYSFSRRPRLPSIIKTGTDFRFSGRPLSFPSALRASRDSSLLGASERTIVNTGGTQYDVTSFIGDLSIPIPKETTTIPPRSNDAIDPEAARIGIARVVTVPPRTPAISADKIFNTTVKPSQRTKSGLPSGVKLKISNPIPTNPIEREAAYERPRPVPPA